MMPSSLPHHYILDARTATPHFPGIGRYVRNVAQELPVLLANDEQLTLLVGSEWQPDDIPFVQVDAGPFSLAQQWQVPRALRALGATVYHSAYYAMPLRPGVPTLLTTYDLIPLFFPKLVSARARLLFSLLTRLSLRSADRVTSISQATADDVQRVFGASSVVIPLAADPIFRPSSDAEIAAMRERLGIPTRYWLYFGANKPHKNLARLIEAFGQCEPSADCPLVIAGTQYPQFAAAEAAAAKLPSSTVRFVGRVSDADAVALYSGTQCFLFVSKYEGFGLPPLEAMACGAPVICSNVSSLPEVVGAAAIQIDPNDVDAIAAAIQRMRDSEQLQASLRQRSLAQAQTFSWRSTAEQVLGQYRLLSKRTP